MTAGDAVTGDASLPAEVNQMDAGAWRTDVGGARNGGAS